MKATNIKWDVDTDDLLAEIDSMSVEDIANILNIPAEQYNSMSTKNQQEYFLNYMHQNSDVYACFLEDFFGLPQEVEIPENLAKQYGEDNSAEDISDWMSDTYECCHGGFEIDEELEKDDDEIEKQ